MILYRFSRSEYSTNISGEGARLKGGRWNSKGFSVIYTSSAISLALLELLIHSASYEEIQSNVLMQIDVPDNPITSLAKTSLKQNWQKDIDYSRFIGNEFLKNKESLLLKVPSAIIPDEYNVLINPGHPVFKKVALVSAKIFEFDIRLFK
jgi:RES domain-containing protein